MIKCNQCGKINATGAMKCQVCGVPLSSTVDGGMPPRFAALEQPELPAWLESLRAGERSAVPANNGANFSPSDFIDEDSLPSWMRAERNETRDNTGATPRVTVRPSSLPGPTTDDDNQPPTGISAQSLLDEQALPFWIREDKQSDPASSQEQFAASSLVQPENVPDWMKSLQREPTTFPGMTGTNVTSPTSPQVSPPPIPQMPVAPPQRSAGVPPSGSPSASSPATPSFPGKAGFSARDLIDPQSLPSWMMQQGERTGQPSPSSQPDPARNQGQPSAPAPATSSPFSGNAGFSARDLIDPQSLPSWMMQQGERTGQPSPSSQPDPARNQGQPVPGQTFSASSLLDVNSLPSWLRDNGQGGQTQQQPHSLPNQSSQALSTTPSAPAFGGTLPASSFLDASSVPDWMRQADPQYTNNASAATSQPATHGTLPASSFLDASSVPDWMRQADPQYANNASAATSQPANPGTLPASSFLDASSVPDWMRQADPQYTNNASAATSQPAIPQVPRTPEPNIYAGPPRVENLRVPNRPRNQINPNENSEVAANVFASMLGVASAAPNYPASSPQPQSSYQQPGLSGNLAQLNMGYPMSQSAMPPSGSGKYAGSGMGAIPNTPEMSSNAPQGYAPSNSYAGSYQGGSYQGGMGSSQMGDPSAANRPYGSSSGVPTPGKRTADAANEQKNAKKRGLFGAILEWLAR